MASRFGMWRNALAGAFLLLGFSVYFSLSGSEAVIRSSLADAHLLSFPFFLLAFALLRIGAQRIPPLVLTLCFLAYTGLALHTSFGLSSDSSKALRVAVFEDDNLEVETSRFLRDLESALAEKGLAPPRRVPRRVSRSLAAVEPAERSSRSFVVSGSRRWLDIFPRRRIEAGDDSSLLFEFIADVPVFGLSTEPRGATVDFLADLHAGVAALREEDGFNEAELYLLSAIDRDAFWTTNAHRAYPAFLLANEYYLRRTASGVLEPALLDCALRLYAVAASFLDSDSNPELRAAVFNNAAVVEFVKESASPKAKYDKALQFFRLAAAQGKVVNPWGLELRVPARAALNLSRVESLLKSSKKSKKTAVKAAKNKGASHVNRRHRKPERASRGKAKARSQRKGSRNL